MRFCFGGLGFNHGERVAGGDGGFGGPSGVFFGGGVAVDGGHDTEIVVLLVPDAGTGRLGFGRRDGLFGSVGGFLGAESGGFGVFVFVFGSSS